MNSGNIMMNVTGHWIKTKNSTVYIDKVDWPENKPCARKLIKKSKNLATQWFKVWIKIKNIYPNNKIKIFLVRDIVSKWSKKIIRNISLP